MVGLDDVDLKGSSSWTNLAQVTIIWLETRAMWKEAKERGSDKSGVGNFVVHSKLHPRLTPESTFAIQCMAVHTQPCEVQDFIDHWQLLSESHRCGLMTPALCPDVQPPMITAVPF